MSYSVFLLGVCVLFFDSGFVWEFVWRFGFVLRVLSDVGENDGCQCESVQIEGVSGVMPGIFGVEPRGSRPLRGDVSEPIVYLFTRFYEINTDFFRKKTLITLMRPAGRAARRCFAFGKTCCRSRFGAANLIL